MDITSAGIDLAKNVMTVSSQGGSGRTVDRRDLPPARYREKLLVDVLPRNLGSLKLE